MVGVYFVWYSWPQHQQSPTITDFLCTLCTMTFEKCRFINKEIHHISPQHSRYWKIGIKNQYDISRIMAPSRICTPPHSHLPFHSTCENVQNGTETFAFTQHTHTLTLLLRQYWCTFFFFFQYIDFRPSRREKKHVGRPKVRFVLIRPHCFCSPYLKTIIRMPIYQNTNVTQIVTNTFEK